MELVPDVPHLLNLLQLPPRQTPVEARQSELVPSMSAVEGVDCVMKKPEQTL